MRRLLLNIGAIILPALIVAYFFVGALREVGEVQQQERIARAQVLDILDGVERLQERQTERLFKRLEVTQARLGARVRQLIKVIREAGLEVPPPARVSPGAGTAPRGMQERPGRTRPKPPPPHRPTPTPTSDDCLLPEPVPCV